MPNSKIKSLTLTIVIPVYNEENYLKACLDAVASQTVMPIEVLVVDNNSSDRSVSIAKSYDFVSVLHEKIQGQTFAQATGFNHAKGNILGRIDADTILPPDWVEKVLEAFKSDSDTIALTGDGVPYDAPLKSAAAGVFRFYHSFVSRVFSGHVMLWGANTALRATGWKRIAPRMSYSRELWEDYEMAFLLSRIGGIRHLKGIGVGCSFRAAHRPLIPQLSYQFRAVKTFRKYKGLLRAVLFCAAWYTMALLFLPMAINRFIWKIRH